MADDLYALPLEDFISSRDAAAKDLRRSGDREGAAVLAKLPKPTPAAWAANQIARTEPDLLQGFLEAGAALRAAQEAALKGEAADLREATRAQRAAVEAFMAAAAPLQPGGKPLSRAMGDRLRTTLMAAAGNEELSHALAEGRLALEAQAGGAWPPPDAEDRAAGPRRASAKPAAKKKAADDRRIVTDSNKRARRKATKADGATPREDATEREDAAEREARAREDAAEREAREKAKREREELEKELRDARGTLKVLQRALTSAEKDANRATTRLDAALAEAEAAREDAEAMHKLLDEAREVLATTRDEIARLEERLD